MNFGRHWQRAKLTQTGRSSMSGLGDSNNYGISPKMRPLSTSSAQRVRSNLRLIGTLCVSAKRSKHPTAFKLPAALTKCGKQRFGAT
jgi:hypothetical protein